jgi:D-cysteine desulfhydrase family pyridoxal phosphate-dependent enzyme
MLDRLSKFPRVALAQAPTPIEPLPRLGAELGIELFVKRDDMTGLAMGGNKARQLEFYFGAARAAKADTILITGAVQSNFIRMAAAAAARLGMAAHVQLEDRVPGMGADYARSGNVLLMDLLGAKLTAYPHGEDEAGADARLHDMAADIRGRGGRPYVIPLAPNHPPLGALGYVVAAQEISDQMTATEQDFDCVVVASGSGLTHGGLLFGLRACGRDMLVQGICVRRPADPQTARITAKCQEIAAMLGVSSPVTAPDIRLDDSALAPGYGRPSGAVNEAIRLTATREGLLLDPVYTGKVMAGLIALARGGAWPKGARVLFIHTGGTPALFAYGEELRST